MTLYARQRSRLITFTDDIFKLRLEDVKSTEVDLSITGEEGIVSSASNKMSQFSHTPESIIK